MLYQVDGTYSRGDSPGPWVIEARSAEMARLKAESLGISVSGVTPMPDPAPPAAPTTPVSAVAPTAGRSWRIGPAAFGLCMLAFLLGLGTAGTFLTIQPFRESSRFLSENGRDATAVVGEPILDKVHSSGFRAPYVHKLHYDGHTDSYTGITRSGERFPVVYLKSEPTKWWEGSRADGRFGLIRKNYTTSELLGNILLGLALALVGFGIPIFLVYAHLCWPRTTIAQSARTDSAPGTPDVPPTIPPTEPMPPAGS